MNKEKKQVKFWPGASNRHKQKAERVINSIITDKGCVTADPKEINHTFSELYKKLYKSEYSILAPP